MKIGGFTKQSFIDWKGKAVAVVFTKGCNLRCGYCHNPSLVLQELMNKEQNVPEKTILDYLNQRKNWLDGIVITGGEPTIHNDLDRFLQLIKKLGFDIKLDTNGSNPAILEKLIKNKLIDYVALDIKTVLDKEKYMEITNINSQTLVEKVKQSIRILRNSSIKYQLRTTILPKYHSSDVIAHLKKEFTIDDNYIFQEYRQGVTIDKLISPI